MKNTRELIVTIVLVLTALGFGSSARAEPITLLGVHAAMTRQEVELVLKKRNYVCAEEAVLWTKTFVCKSGKKIISMDGEEIFFNCENFNACGLTLQEFAQAIVDQGIIDDLSYETEWLDFSDLGGNAYWQEKYCGRGEEGDRLCIQKDENLLGGETISVILNPGRLNSDKPSFK